MKRWQVIGLLTLLALAGCVEFNDAHANTVELRGMNEKGEPVSFGEMSESQGERGLGMYLMTTNQKPDPNKVAVFRPITEGKWIQYPWGRGYSTDWKLVGYSNEIIIRTVESDGSKGIAVCEVNADGSLGTKAGCVQGVKVDK